MGAFIMNGITPGPFLFKEQPQLVWTVIASFFVGNVLLLILNLPLVGLWAKLLKIPFSYMCAGVLIFCVIGAYGLKQSLFDVWVMLGFGILGYLLRKLDFPIAPAILALILGPMMERSLRTTLEISGGELRHLPRPSGRPRPARHSGDRDRLPAVQAALAGTAQGDRHRVTRVPVVKQREE